MRLILFTVEEETSDGCEWASTSRTSRTLKFLRNDINSPRVPSSVFLRLPLPLVLPSRPGPLGRSSTEGLGYRGIIVGYPRCESSIEIPEDVQGQGPRRPERQTKRLGRVPWGWSTSSGSWCHSGVLVAETEGSLLTVFTSRSPGGSGGITLGRTLVLEAITSVYNCKLFTTFTL